MFTYLLKSDLNPWNATMQGCEIRGVSIAAVVIIVLGYCHKAEQEELIREYRLAGCLANRRGVRHSEHAQVRESIARRDEAKKTKSKCRCSKGHIEVARLAALEDRQIHGLGNHKECCLKYYTRHCDICSHHILYALAQ
jgi:hypothetical protein